MRKNIKSLPRNYQRVNLLEWKHIVTASYENTTSLKIKQRPKNITMYIRLFSTTKVYQKINVAKNQSHQINVAKDQSYQINVAKDQSYQINIAKDQRHQHS